MLSHHFLNEEKHNEIRHMPNILLSNKLEVGRMGGKKEEIKLASFEPLQALFG